MSYYSTSFVIRYIAVITLCILFHINLQAQTVPCDEDTPVDANAPFSVTLSFWESDDVPDNNVPDPASTPPTTSLEFTWTDSPECFVWVRMVSPALGGGVRTNVASDFTLTDDNGVTVLTYTQNANKCCDEFATPGTVKTFRSDTLVEDETTGQTGDPLKVGITASRSESPTSISDASSPASTPKLFGLKQNFPNPFNPETTIAYNVPRQAHITITVHNLIGQEVVRLVNAERTPGAYSIRWDGTNAKGEAVGSGVYLYHLKSSSGYTETRRMTLVK